MVFHGFSTSTVDGPAKSKSPVENGGKHPMIYRVSTIVVQDFSQPSTVVQSWAGIYDIQMLRQAFDSI